MGDRCLEGRGQGENRAGDVRTWWCERKGKWRGTPGLNTLCVLVHSILPIPFAFIPLKLARRHHVQGNKTGYFSASLHYTPKWR